MKAYRQFRFSGLGRPAVCWVVWVLTFGLVLTAVGAANVQGASSTGGEPAVRYRLIQGSFLVDDCTICGRPVVPVPIRGGFWLRPTGEDPLFANYDVLHLAFESRLGDPRYSGRLNGAYRIGGEVALVQQMTLEGSIDEFTDLQFDSGIVGLQAPWPWIEIDLPQMPPTDPLHTFSLHLVAVPWPNLWFSTETGMTPGVAGLPHISKGDLVSSTGRVVRTNAELTAHLGIMPGVPDVGLDAVVGPVRAGLPAGGVQGCEVWFSPREGIFSERLGPLYDGDVLSDAGAIVRRYSELIDPFMPQPPIADLGLDVVAIDPEGRVLFSTKQDFFSQRLGRMISHGDLLREDGQIFRTGGELMRNFQPMDPIPKVFGLDAAGVWPNGEVWFSITTSFADVQLGQVGYGDLLSDTGRVVMRNLDLVGPFQPLEDLADFGLDGLSILMPTYTSDLDLDGTTNLVDLAIFGGAWALEGDCLERAAADLNADGRVDFHDVLDLAANWLAPGD